MNILFLNELTDMLSETVETIIITNQKEAKNILDECRTDFPMVSFEYTNDSNFQVDFDESKFINDSVHDGTWIIGKTDGVVKFVVNLISVEGNILEIDILEINSENRGMGIASNVVSVIESASEDFFDEIIITPFDTDAINFWEHMGYVESEVYAGYWSKSI